jgi:ATP-dependent exoDNAse (exonuclease V) beta subunit
VILSDGKLTLVGDPKQSIYDFAGRASQCTNAFARLSQSNHLEVKLSANFHSVPPLIDWFNDRFPRILGTSPDGNPFDPASAKVFHQALVQGREGGAGEAVRVLPFDLNLDLNDGEKHVVDEYRDLEGRVLPRYLRWLVEESGFSIIDSMDGRARRINYGDIAILAVSTWGSRFCSPGSTLREFPARYAGERCSSRSAPSPVSPWIKSFG